MIASKKLREELMVHVLTFMFTDKFQYAANIHGEGSWCEMEVFVQEKRWLRAIGLGVKDGEIIRHTLESARIRYEYMARKYDSGSERVVVNSVSRQDVELYAEALDVVEDIYKQWDTIDKLYKNVVNLVQDAF